MLYQAVTGIKSVLLLMTFLKLSTLGSTGKLNSKCPQNTDGQNLTNVIYVKRGHLRSDVCKSMPEGFRIFEENRVHYKHGEVTNFRICKNRSIQQIALLFDGRIEQVKGEHGIALVVSCNQDHDTLILEDGYNFATQVQVSVKFRRNQQKLGVANVRSRNQSYLFTIRSEENMILQKRESRSKRRANLGSPNTHSLTMTMTDISACGHSKGCFRYGDSSDCGHMSCKYFVSYDMNRVTEMINFELSAKTNGWVAIGFSSDETMGGMDDIFVCMRDMNSNNIRVTELTAKIRHQRPLESQSHANMTHYMEKDGHIYCKFTALGGKRVHKSKLDLTNDWYQQYARGPMSAHGNHIGKHTQTPFISKRKISLLEKINVFTNSATRTLSNLNFVLIITVITLVHDLG